MSSDVPVRTGDRKAELSVTTDGVELLTNRNGAAHGADSNGSAHDNGGNGGNGGKIGRAHV